VRRTHWPSWRSNERTKALSASQGDETDASHARAQQANERTKVLNASHAPAQQANEQTKALSASNALAELAIERTKALSA